MENIGVKLLESRTESSEYRIKELEGLLRHAEQKNNQNSRVDLSNLNYEFAKQTLKLKSEDMKDQHRRESNRDKFTFCLITFSIFMFFAFTVIAMMMNKDAILADILKVLAYVFGVGLTGYGIGLQKGKDKGEKVKE